jgi:hypothetical protein
MLRITDAVAGYTVIAWLITAIVSKAYHALGLFLINNEGRKIIVTLLLYFAELYQLCNLILAAYVASVHLYDLSPTFLYMHLCYNAEPVQWSQLLT